MDPAIGMVETNSVAAGIEVADAMVKRAPVQLLEARPVCPGKFIVLVSGLTDPVNEAMEAGRAVGRDWIVDHLLLPNVHLSVFPALTGSVAVKDVEALGIFETISVASTIVAADAAAKAADITLTEIRLANGLGGKSFFLLVGALEEVQAGVKAALDLTKEVGLLVNAVIVPQLHEQMRQKIMV